MCVKKVKEPHSIPPPFYWSRRIRPGVLTTMALDPGGRCTGACPGLWMASALGPLGMPARPYTRWGFYGPTKPQPSRPSNSPPSPPFPISEGCGLHWGPPKKAVKKKPPERPPKRRYHGDVVLVVIVPGGGGGGGWHKAWVVGGGGGLRLMETKATGSCGKRLGKPFAKWLGSRRAGTKQLQPQLELQGCDWGLTDSHFGFGGGGLPLFKRTLPLSEYVTSIPQGIL